MRNLLLLVTITVAFVLNGCGGGLKTVNVTGTVTFDGEPLAEATIAFSPETSGEGHPGYAITDVNGHYKLQTLLGNPDAGTTPGKYLVTVSKMEKSATTTTSSDDPEYMRQIEMGRMGTPPPPKSLIPVSYGNMTTSGLSATVENKKENVFDFNLTSN
jgi:hypothetical protein